MPDFVYDLPRLLAIYRTEQALARHNAPALRSLETAGFGPSRYQPLHSNSSRKTLGVLAGSFNPLTRGHMALVEAARRAGADAVLLLLPLRAIDKEAVTRASAVDRALMLTEWAAHQTNVGVAFVNRGLYVEQAVLLTAAFPDSRIMFIVGHDKIAQIFDPRYYEDRDVALRALFAQASFRVAPRAGQDDGALRALLTREENAPFAASVASLAVDANVDALSSTVVRERARVGAPWEALVPSEAAHFIREAQPYSPPMRLSGGEEIDLYGLRQAILHGAATGRLGLYPGNFEQLSRTAIADTEDGRATRRWIAEDLPRRGVDRIDDTVDQPIEALIRTLSDVDRGARLRAAQALGFRYATEAVEPLMRALGDEDHYVGEYAKDALVMIGAPAVSPLIQAIEDKGEHPTRRWRAAQALGSSGDARALEPLVAVLEDQGDDAAVRKIAAFYLGRLGDARALPVLERVRQDSAPAFSGRTVAEAAAHAIQLIERQRKT